MERPWIDRLAHDLSATRAELLGLALLVAGGVVLAVVVVGRVEGEVVEPAGVAPSAAPGGGTVDAPGSTDGGSAPGDQAVVGPGGAVAGGEVGGATPSAAGGDAAGDVAAGGVAGGGGAGDDASPTEVVVHVSGAVARPGVLALPAGSRLVDAVDAAGGMTETADPDVLNLAAQLVDGQRLHVPTREEVATAAAGPSAAPDGSAVVAAPPGLDPTTGRPPSAPPSTPLATEPAALDLNRASATDLEELPGVGPVLAGRIVEWREQHDGFTSVGQLRDVSGIGEKTFQALAPLVVVS